MQICSVGHPILMRSMNDTFFEIGFVQHCEKRSNAQQDALWNGERAVQLAHMAPAKRFCDGDEALLLAVADVRPVDGLPDCKPRRGQFWCSQHADRVCAVGQEPGSAQTSRV